MTHPSTHTLVVNSARAFEALSGAVSRIELAAQELELSGVLDRGLFTPSEEEPLFAWFARFLTLRDGLWRIIAEVSEPVEGDLRRVEDEGEWRLFLLGYASACLVVKLDRFLVEEFARHKLIQRKLNEGSPELRIPRKQFTAIFDAVSKPRSALLLAEARRLAERERPRLEALVDDVEVSGIARGLEELESSLQRGTRKFLRKRLAFRRHSLRRRGASAKQKAAFAALEASGRLLSELRDRWRSKRVGADVRREIAQVLRPGDVIVTRHERALTNLFLPGFWPHAALYVGTEEEREALGLAIDSDRRERWSGDRCVLEALKDGVLFRSLEETLSVDAFCVVRPRLDSRALGRGIARVSRHEGKLYNFDFDFFRSDRLVCTEVVYRAFDGIEGFQLPLTERAGRPTLSAEDLLDLALAGELFSPVAVFGIHPSPEGLIFGEEARSAIAASYRE